jgi:translation elongation factor EF-Tu-like GTPase
MTVNVGTIGHVDHGQRVLVVDDGRGIGLRLAKMIDMTGVEVVSESEYRAIVDAPAPKPAKRLTAADLNRIEAAEAKRQRRIERNKQRGDV